MTGRTYRTDQNAVSDTVGTVLLVGITVALFAGLSVVVMDELQRSPPPPDVEFQVSTIDGRTTVALVWGEPLELDDSTLLFSIDSLRQTLPLTDAALAPHLAQLADGSAARWDLGESLRLACPLAESCAYPGQEAGNVTIIQASASTVLFSSEPGVVPGDIVSPVADLVASIGPPYDPLRTPGEPLYAGGTFVVPTTVSNGGLLATASGSTVTASYYLDGSATPFHSYSRPGLLAPGASFLVENVPLSLAQGSHSVRVHVEATPPFAEAGLANNDATVTLNVVAGVFDPGAPFEDANNDVLYNPYVAGDQLLAAADVTDGVHTTAVNKGLVIPASVGTITKSNADLTFVASRKLDVAVGLTTTSTRNIVLTAGTDLNLTGTVQLRSAHEIRLTAASKIDVSGDSLDTNNQDIILTTTSGPILAVGTNFYIVGLGSIPDDLRVTANLGLVDVQGSVAAVDDDILFTVNGPLYVKNVNFDAGGIINLDVTVLTNTVYVQNAYFEDGNNCADVDPTTAPIVGTTNPAGRVGGSC
ncbi:MAG TPA: type IV pilin N-terminal domain-containing protein [Candidatus Thermoplasmatota archaeon]|nr:type IV pilin N-terminal domain-containing protein [Candidatus Thermoplasmatota archaeon]